MPSSRVRYAKSKRLFAVRSDAEKKQRLTAFGTGPWVSVRINPTRRRSGLAGMKPGRETVQRINAGRAAAGQKPIDASDWSASKKAGVQNQQLVGSGLRIRVEPRSYREYVFGREAMEGIEYGKRRKMLRRERKEGPVLLRQAPHLLASGALLLIGEKWLFVPRRAAGGRLHSGMFQHSAGRMEAEPRQFVRKKFPTPARTALAELEEETGIPPKSIELLGPGLKKAGRQKKALAVAQSFEGLSPGHDIIFLARAKTAFPDDFLETHFEKNAGGEWVPKKGKDKWETAGSSLVEQSSAAIARFIRENAHQVVPITLVALKALELELERRGR